MRIKGIADLIARLSLILFAFLLPLFVIPESFAAIAQGKMLLACTLALLALVAWFVARLSEGAILMPRSSTLAASVLLPLAYLISAFASHASAISYVSGDGTQDTVAAVALLSGVLVLFALVFFEKRDISLALMPLCAFFFGAGVVVLVQFVRLLEPSWLQLGGALSGSASSLIGDWQDLGIFAGLLVLFVSALWSSPYISRMWWRVAFVLVGVLSFLLLVVINMIDVWYTLAAFLLIVAVCQWSTARLRDKRSRSDSFLRAAVCFFVGLLALLGAFSSAFLVAQLPNSWQISQSEVRPSLQGTLVVGEQVFKGSGFIFGSGPNTFMQAWDDFKPAAINQSSFWNEDFESGFGVIPTSFITAGSLGALAWLALMLALLFLAWRALVPERLTSARILSAVCSLGALYLVVFHVLYTPGLALSLLLFMLIGLSVALEAEGWSPLVILLSTSIMGVLRIVLVLVLVCLFAFACIYDVRATVSDLLVSESTSQYNANSNIGSALVLIEDALVWYPSNDAAHRAGVELGLAQLQELLAQGQTASATQLQSTLSATIQQGLQAVSINSADYQNWLSLAGVYQSLGGEGVSGAYQSALSAYQKAALADPTNPLPLVGAAEAAEGLNDATSSMQYLTQSIALKPDLAAAYYLRSQVEAGQGDLTDATQDAETAVSLAEQDPTGWYNLGSILYSSGDYPDAVSALKQAVSLENNYADALFVLSLAYDQTGDAPDALSTMQQVVQLDPQDQTATQALTNLEAGRSAFATSTPAATTKKTK